MARARAWTKVLSMILAFRRNPGLLALWLLCVALLASLALLTPRVLAYPAPSGGAVAPVTFGQASLTAPAPVFRVLHDDHIGPLKLPAGDYAVTPFGGMSASQATQRFTRFLQDYDGKLPAPWTLDAGTATFSRGSAGFTIATAPAASTPTVTTAGTVCPGVFSVEHDDRIGPLAFPAGSYQITSLRSTCAANVNAFRRLLARSDDRLPAPWSLAPQTGTFGTSAGSRFRVKQA
jgi:hypothetical protein